MKRFGQPARALVSLLACSALAIETVRAEPPTETEAATAVQAQEAPPAEAPAPAPDAAPDAAPAAQPEAAGDELEPEAEPSADLSGFRERELRAKLLVAQRDEQDTSMLLPWVVTAVGWGLVLAGTAVGVGTVLACDEESCSGPWWPTWLVMGGSLVGSLGTVWLVLETRDLAELRLRRMRIERMLQEQRWNQPSNAGPRAALSVSGHFDL